MLETLPWYISSYDQTLFVLTSLCDMQKTHTDFQKESVLKVLRSLNIDKTLLSSKYVEVWNKVDLLDSSKVQELTKESNKNSVILVSAKKGVNCDLLLEKIDAVLKETYRPK